MHCNPDDSQKRGKEEGAERRGGRGGRNQNGHQSNHQTSSWVHISIIYIDPIPQSLPKSLVVLGKALNKKKQKKKKFYRDQCNDERTMQNEATTYPKMRSEIEG